MKSKSSDDAHSNAKLKEIVSVLSLKSTKVTQSILCPIFLMYVSTRQHLNYSGQESKSQVAVHNSDTLRTLKQGQGHQTWYTLVDHKQDYNNAKLEKPYLYSVCEKPTIKLLSNQETKQLSPIHMCERQ